MTTQRDAELSFSFEEWAKYGWEQGWCGPPICYTHDGLPGSDQEFDQWHSGDDICIHIVRLYEDLEQKTAVEKNHVESVYRASNRRWVNR